MTRRLNIVVSSAGRRVGLVETFRSALDRTGVQGEVFAADRSPMSSAFHAADRGFIVPDCSDTSFVTHMLALCERHSVGLIVPTIDTELPIYAAHRERFEAAGVKVAVSSQETVRIASDKVRTHDWFCRRAFPTVNQWMLGSVPDRPASADGLVAKPRNGSASVGVVLIDRPEQLGTLPSTGYVVESFARGEEYTIDAFVDRSGRCRCAVPRRRIEVRAGESSKGMTVCSPPLEQLARSVCEALPGAWGPITLQAFLEGESDVSLIEINPRFGGGFPLSHVAGADYPTWMVQDAIDRPLDPFVFSWRTDLVMLRYDEAVFLPADQAGDP